MTSAVQETSASFNMPQLSKHESESATLQASSVGIPASPPPSNSPTPNSTVRGFPADQPLEIFHSLFMYNSSRPPTPDLHHLTHFSGPRSVGSEGLHSMQIPQYAQSHSQPNQLYGDLMYSPPLPFQDQIEFSQKSSLFQQQASETGVSNSSSSSSLVHPSMNLHSPEAPDASVVFQGYADHGSSEGPLYNMSPNPSFLQSDSMMHRHTKTPLDAFFISHSGHHASAASTPYHGISPPTSAFDLIQSSPQIMTHPLTESYTNPIGEPYGFADSQYLWAPTDDLNLDFQEARDGSSYNLPPPNTYQMNQQYSNNYNNYSSPDLKYQNNYPQTPELLSLGRNGQVPGYGTPQPENSHLLSDHSFPYVRDSPTPLLRSERADSFIKQKYGGSGEREYECDICFQKMKRLNDLRRHLMTHSKEKPFKCKYCDKGFARQDALRRHEKDVDSGKKMYCRKSIAKLMAKRSADSADPYVI